MAASWALLHALGGVQIKSGREVGIGLRVHELSFPEPIKCAMCGKVMHLGRLESRYGVPWYCGPVLEADGGRDVCEPCYQTWLAWFRSMCYWGA